MGTRHLLAAVTLAGLFATSARAQEPLTRRADGVPAFEYPEIERVTEMPTSDGGTRIRLDFVRPGADGPPLPGFRESYWKEGMIVGGVITLLLLLSLSGDLEGAKAGEVAGGVLMVGGVLSIVGALLGGMIPK